MPRSLDYVRQVDHGWGAEIPGQQSVRMRRLDLIRRAVVSLCRRNTRIGSTVGAVVCGGLGFVRLARAFGAGVRERVHANFSRNRKDTSHETKVGSWSSEEGVITECLLIMLSCAANSSLVSLAFTLSACFSYYHFLIISSPRMLNAY